LGIFIKSGQAIEQIGKAQANCIW